jgi:hypothetical protein
MKLLLYTLLFVLAVSCKPEPKVFNGQPVGEASAAPAQMPPADMMETTVLLSRFWVFEHWIDTAGPDGNKNKGRWYRFYEDGTYDGGHWEDHNDHGTWFLKKGGEYTELFIDSEINDLKDAKWQIQGINGMQDAMSWVKTKEFGDQRSALCKLNGMLSIPTKAQFGLE